MPFCLPPPQQPATIDFLDAFRATFFHINEKTKTKTKISVYKKVEGRQ